MLAWLLKLVKFGAVGGLGILTDFFITWCFKEKMKWNKYFANACGFCVAVVQNYTLNRYWTFQSHDQQVLLQFSKFFVISLIGLALNTGILLLLHERFKVPFYLSKVLAIGLVFFWNFSANYYFTF